MGATAKMSAPDAGAVTEAFQFFDQDNDEKLSRQDFEKMVQSLGQTPTQAALKKLLDENVDGDELVTKAACDAMMPAIVLEKKDKDAVMNAFAVFDNRSDGNITVVSFRSMMGGVGEKLKPAEVNAAIEQLRTLDMIVDNPEYQEETIAYAAYVNWMFAGSS